MTIRIAIGADHAGFELKECVKARLVEWQHDVLDLGTNSAKPVDYPDYAEAVGLAVREGRRRSICCSNISRPTAAPSPPKRLTPAKSLSSDPESSHHPI